MDDMETVESKVKEVEQVSHTVATSAHAPINESAPVVVQESAPVAAILDNVTVDIASRAHDRVNSEKVIDKRAKELANVANERIKNEIERQSVENERKAADNKIDRKELANRLYQIKQESKRLKKEQRHLSAIQKQEHKRAKLHAYWEAHGETLEQYKMHEGSSLVACNILLWLDGVKSFFLGLSEVSDSIIKALKYVLIIGGIAAVLLIIPVTREWLLNLLGFTK